MMMMMLQLNLVESHEFRFREPLERLANILRKWSKLCISFDFDRNEAQMAFNGKVRGKIVGHPLNCQLNGNAV